MLLNSPVLLHSNPPHLLQSTVIKSPPIHPYPRLHPPLISTQDERIVSVIVTMRSLPLLLLPLLLIAIHSPPRALAALQATRKVLVGGWQPIENIGDPHVQKIAEFAVSEHNKLANTSLALSKVVKGETQVVDGINYRLDIETKDGNAMANYVAVVWEKDQAGFMKLISFTAVKK